MKKTILQCTLAAGAALALVACGGGDDGGSGGGRDQPISRIDYGQAKVVEGALTNYWDNRCNPLPQGGGTASALPVAQARVYTGKHTVTVAYEGVSAAQQQTVAQYAEATVEYMRQKLDITGDRVGFGDDVQIAICAYGTGSGGTGASQSLDVSVNNIGSSALKQLVLHELVHVSHNRLSNCGPNDHGFYMTSKWFSEGAALYLAGQDTYSRKNVQQMRDSMGHENPYDWIQNGWFGYERYPVYRLALEALVDGSGSTEDDVWDFTKSYFAQNNSCSTNGYLTFNAAISSYFGNLLDDPAFVNSFWTTTLDKYAR